MFASNHQQVFRRQLSTNGSNMNSNNSDNVVKANKSNSTVMNGAMSKTPAASSSKQRRALGDISNRKQGKSHNNGGGVSLKKAPTPGGLRILPLQPQQQRSSKRSEVSFLPRPTISSSTTKQAPLMTIFPDANNNKSKAPKSILKRTTNTKSSTVMMDDAVDDIELPAGRLWIDQQADFDDDDDNCSLGSLSLPGAATLLEDYHPAVRKRHALRLKMTLEEERREQAAFEEYEKKLFEEDGKLTIKQVVMKHIYVLVIVCLVCHER